MSKERQGFFRRIRVRMRLAWLSSTAQQLAPYAALVVVALFAIEWLIAWDGALIWSLILAAGLLGGLVIAAASLTITDWDASRAAELGLGAKDAFTTALEFDSPDDDVHRVIQIRADQLAGTAEARKAIPVSAQPRKLRQAGVTGALAILIAIIPPLGDTALSSDLEAAIEAEAEAIERLAEAVAQADVDNGEEIGAELEALAKELRLAETLEKALDAIDDARMRLEAGLDPQFLSQKAAAQGLARDLTLRPLTTEALDPGDQLEEVAAALGQLSSQELAALQDRLADLAASQAAGNPGLSSQLSAAASALAAGDLKAASRALGEAGAGQRAGVDQARGQQALTEATRALDGVAARLGGGGAGQGQGQGDGQTEGQGAGGQSGQPGSGGQSGSPSGVISGVAPGQGDASGQGGQGTVGSGPGNDYGTEVDTSGVYDPAGSGTVTDLLQVHIEGGSAQGQVIGRGETTTRRGDSIVPYAQVLPEYLSEAADALAALRLPPSMRGIVQSYFEILADEAR